MTPPPPTARFAHLDLLFVKPLAAPTARARRVRLAWVPFAAIAVAALLGAHAQPATVDWGAVTAGIEPRIRAEDILLFDGPEAERAWASHALRADDRRVLPRDAGALAGRRRAWLVLAGERASRGEALSSLTGWRELDRVSFPGVDAVLLEREEAH